MSSLRKRNRSQDIVGTYRSSIDANNVTKNRTMLVRSSCEDVLGNRDGDNHLDLIKDSYEGVPVSNGFRNADTPGHPYNASVDNYPYSGWPSASTTLTLPSRTVEQDFTRLFARTNPSRSEVSIPQFIAEMKDLPRMLRHLLHVGSYSKELSRVLGRRSRLEDIKHSRNKLGKYLLIPEGRRPSNNHGLPWLTESAAANLAIQFGWEPMVKDVVTMLSLGSSIEARRKEITRLHNGRGLKRRIELGSITSSSTVDVQVLSEAIFGSLSVQSRVSRTARRWGTVTYRPLYPDSAPPSDADIWRVLTGITLSSAPSLLWELLPWSWLADYFTNVGDYLSAASNEVGAHVGSACVMTHVECVTVVPLRVWEWVVNGNIQGRVTTGPVVKKYERKMRSVWSTSGTPLRASIPFLQERQVSILGSLIVARGSNRRRDLDKVSF